MFHFRCEQSFKCLKRCQRLIGVIKLISGFLFAFFHAPFNPVLLIFHKTLPAAAISERALAHIHASAQIAIKTC